MLTSAELVAALPAMRKYARRLTHSVTDAEDLVQATALRAWEKRALYVDLGKPTAWVLAIMHNMRATGIAQESRSPIVDVGYQPDPAADEPQPWRALLREVGEAIDRLPPRQRIIVLNGATGASYDEIARQLSIPTGTVRSRWSRARAGLRATFQQKDAP
jgi:RNA polymerase sigma-70 factor (ECF subfamily)